VDVLWIYPRHFQRSGQLLFTLASLKEQLHILGETVANSPRPSCSWQGVARYGITSERNLVEELRMHLAWRWFTGLGFDQEMPHHSTFSKNRHGTVSGVEVV
jgi:hypothetical protein